MKRERNEQGQVTYFENSFGYWEKYKYDTNGNEIYREYDDGSWEKFEHDASGNLTYWETSDKGVIFDEREQTKPDLDEIGV